MFIRFDVIHERDGQTDGQTLRDSKYRAYASHRALIQEAQLSLTNRAMLVCKVVEVWQDFCQNM